MVRYVAILACGLLTVGCEDRSLDGTRAIAIATRNTALASAVTPPINTAQVELNTEKSDESKLKERIRATLVQYNCSNNKQESVGRLLELVSQCAPNSDLILLGETVFAPYTTCKDFSAIAETVPGPFTESLSQIAAQHKVHICSGVVEKEGNKLFNTAVLIGPKGQILLKYRKTSLTTVDERSFQPGIGPTVVDTDLGRIGILICKDSQDLDVVTAIARQNPQLILVPSYGLAKSDYFRKLEIDCMVDECIDEWRLRMQALAKVCHAFVLRADHVGLEEEQVRVGHSIAVSSGGYVIAEATMRPVCLDVVLKANSPDQKHW